MHLRTIVAGLLAQMALGAQVRHAKSSRALSAKDFVGARAAKTRCATEQDAATLAGVAVKPQNKAAPQVRPRDDVVIQTYLHVIANGETESGGWISDEALEEQMAVLNANFNGTGFSFNWVREETTRTVNTNWTNFPWDWGWDFPDTLTWEKDWKAQLRKGGDDLKALNIYFNPGLPAYGVGVLIDQQIDVDRFVDFDGVIIEPSTVPGGPDPRINEGKTLTHEVGHWLGLYHTFQDGCFDGDKVKDTPPADYPFTSFTYCSDPYPNTCIDTMGPNGTDANDPNNNYMSYSIDPCMDEFTPGQIERFHQIWQEYRV